jgi:3-oxoacyl-[acyl-carrier protein] reductase
MDLGLKNKVAIVTGASKGMGLAITKAYLAEGAKVMMVARDEAALKKHVEFFRKENKQVEYVAGDVADRGLAKQVVDKTIQLWGEIHILINNAGGPAMGGFLEHAESVWDSAVQTNLMSVIRFCQAAAPFMKENKWGRIISITSTAAKEPAPVMVLSSTVRAGVGAFTKAIATELAPFNISANVICPGGVLTERLENLIQARSEREGRDFQELLQESQLSIPAKRFANPSEIANAILFLTSEKGGYINGVSLAVDGGLLKSF